ncbi:protein of unknown function [Serratia sp. Tan611]|nr:protein of unknown function [Serratia sp. Tan611]
MSVMGYAYRASLLPDQTDIMLAGIMPLLNLYAKKFRCPDVLTSIRHAINLYASFIRL